MEQKTENIGNQKAALLQSIYKKFNCEIIELGLSGKDTVRVTVQGSIEDLQRLFEFLENPPIYENTEAKTV